MIGIKVEGNLESAVVDALAEMPEVEYVVVTAGSFDILVEVVCEDDDHLLELLNERIRKHPRRPPHRVVRLPETDQADLQLGYPHDSQQL